MFENSYICSPKNNKLIQLWYNEFMCAININFINYQKIFKQEYPNETDLIWWLPYLTQHACLYRIIKKIPN